MLISVFLALFLAPFTLQDSIGGGNSEQSSAKDQKLHEQELVDYVNRKQSLFKAVYSPLSKARLENLMKIEFLEHDEKAHKKLPVLTRNVEPETLPESFDTRTKWPHCRSVIETIRDQSMCGSCWAVSAAETMTDRLCINSNGTIKIILSDTDILACCEDCGNGCSGGYTQKAWEYVYEHGVCSGGLYRTKDSCKPYAFHPCGFHKGQTFYGNCPTSTWPTPPCKRFCQRGYHNKYQKDKTYAATAYIVGSDEVNIMAEIMENGPVQASFSVYEDFGYYSGGIYHYTYGKEKGGHAVKITGWGVENGTKYWTIANSWNSDWGENGFFRMIRGVNDCGIEGRIVTGIMEV